MPIGENIKRLRKEKKLTQEELSALLGVSKSAVSLYEVGKAEPNITALKLLSQYFRIPIDELVGNTLITGDAPTIKDIANDINKYAVYHNKDISDNKKELIMNILALMLED